VLIPEQLPGFVPNLGLPLCGWQDPIVPPARNQLATPQLFPFCSCQLSCTVYLPSPAQIRSRRKHNPSSSGSASLPPNWSKLSVSPATYDYVQEPQHVGPVPTYQFVIGQNGE